MTSAGEKVLVKVGISAVSAEGARKNLDAENPGWDFDAISANATVMWNKELSKITVEGGTHDQAVNFYTALYHAMLSPNLYMDVDGQYRGRDLQVHTADGFDYYTVFISGTHTVQQIPFTRSLTETDQRFYQHLHQAV